ncbi:ATPase, ParA type [Nocardia farcinica]|uniref:ParA family protein n=1 Tax=Nocardia farcinica TaxID=37329 RepID=UPI000E01C52E|nr:AAA family ATPase [Nocardia farcinica]SUH41119.1 ATPase, ParA type [Nocardia farcinica]
MANQKGGVGKTATTLGLASAIAHFGRTRGEGGRVLVMDMDPQGNATSGVGVEVVAGQQPTVADLFDRSAQPGALADVVVASAWDLVDIAPATRDLAGVEEAGDADLVWRLDAAFDGVDLSAYDAVLFDCPPSLGRLLFSALVAADQAVVVTEATKDSVKGVTEVEETIERVRRRPNPRLELGAIVVSRRRNNGEHNFREAELRQAYGTLGDSNGGLVCRTVIPDLAARQDAHSAATPIHLFHGGRALALQIAYTDLATELGLLKDGVSA